MARYYTLKQAAKELGVSVRTVRRRVDEGHLPVKRGHYPNSPLRITELDLAAYKNRMFRGEYCDARR